MSTEEQSPESVLHLLRQNTQTLLLSTVGEDGFPHCGYTPFIFGDTEQSKHQLYIFVSQLALHTRDLLNDARVSVMLIQDETQADQIFARTRVSYQCVADIINKNSPLYDPVLDQLQHRHGKVLGLLRTLPDFVLFRLTPRAGQFVMGFGQAFRLKGEHFDRLEHARSA